MSEADAARTPQPAPEPPPPLPPVDGEGRRLRSGVGAQRRRLARRRLLRPATVLVLGLVAFVLLGLLQPSSGPLLPPEVEALQARLPDPLAGLDLLQVLLLPFLVIAALEVVRGAVHMRRAARAWLQVDRVGRLDQADGEREHVDLDHLVAVDVAPNTAFTHINERTPVGSLLLLRLIDKTGQGIDVNPGMWAEEHRIIDIVRRYAWDSDATITPEAAERYALPVRGRGGHEHVGATALDDSPLHTEEEREAALRVRGIDLQRAPRPGTRPRGSGPGLEGTPTGGEAEPQAPLGERGGEVQGGTEVQPDRLHE